MRYAGNIIWLFAILSVITLIPGGAEAADRRFIEDFNTKQYCDRAGTTALWDTVAGEVRLAEIVISQASFWPTQAGSFGAAVSGNYAYIADWTDGIAVIDITYPDNCAYAGSCNTPGSARAVVVEEDYAFVADQGSGLQVIDISDPSGPSAAGSFDTPGSAMGVAIHGDYALVADGTGGLQVIDISDPGSPSFAGSVATAGEANAVAAEGNIACVADGAGGLQVIDITDPSTPKIAGTYDTPGTAWDAVMDGDLVYLADGPGGFLILDISDPEFPSYVGGCPTPSPALGLHVAGSYAYVGAGASGLLVINAGDPSSPSIMDSYDTPGDCSDVVVAGEYAFAADGSSGLRILDVAAHCIFSQAGYTSGITAPMDIALSGRYLYVLDESGELNVVRVTDPPEWFMTIVTSVYLYDTDTRCIAAAGDVLLVGGHSFVSSVDITYPESPSTAGFWNADGRNVIDIEVSGDRAYALTGASAAELVVLDISNPLSPDSIAACAVSSYPASIDIEGDILYIVHEYGGLEVVDISDPSSPAHVTVIPLTGRPVDVAVSGDLAYIAGYDSVMLTVDVSDPSAPSAVSSLPLGGRAVSIAVNGDRAVVGGAHALYNIDISAPASPSIAESSMLGGDARGLLVDGDYVYFVDDYAARTYSVMNRRWECGGSIAQSLDTNPIDGKSVVGVYCDYSDLEMSGLVGISFSAYGTQWQQHMLIGYEDLEFWGSEFFWRSTHSTSSLYPDQGSVLGHIEFELFYYCAIIDSIVDVPGDQGGWARVHFTCSGLDHPDSERDDVIGYTVFRRVDDPALLAELEKGGPEMDAGLLDGRYFVTAGDAAAPGLPDGTWESVAYTSAFNSVHYICLVPTLEDSSASFENSVYCVFAQMTFGGSGATSPPDSGYSVDNLAPAVPLNLAVAYNTGSGNHVEWDPSPEPDFQFYRIYRGESETFVPGPGTLVYTTTLPEWDDPGCDGWDVHYKVTAVDRSGNESHPASAGTTTEDESPHLPGAFALYQNVPNPFNPSTVIAFDLPEAAHVDLRIYNVRGELVATLAGGRFAAGRREIAWDGRDSGGMAAASGIYFYRLTAGDFVETRKMVLLK